MEGGDVSGALCISQAWPGMARTIYGDHQRFVDAYFRAYPGEELGWIPIPSPWIPGLMFPSIREPVKLMTTECDVMTLWEQAWL